MWAVINKVMKGKKTYQTTEGLLVSEKAGRNFSDFFLFIKGKENVFHIIAMLQNPEQSQTHSFKGMR